MCRGKDGHEWRRKGNNYFKLIFNEANINLKKQTHRENSVKTNTRRQMSCNKMLQKLLPSKCTLWATSSAEPRGANSSTAPKTDRHNLSYLWLRPLCSSSALRLLGCIYYWLSNFLLSKCTPSVRVIFVPCVPYSKARCVGDQRRGEGRKDETEEDRSEEESENR